MYKERNNELSHTLVEHMPVGIYVLDKIGSFSMLIWLLRNCLAELHRPF